MSNIEPHQERLPDIVRKRLKPMKDLTTIKKELIEWLDNNPPWVIPQHERPHALLTLSLLIDKIHDWGMKNRNHQEDLDKLQ